MRLKLTNVNIPTDIIWRIEELIARLGVRAGDLYLSLYRNRLVLHPNKPSLSKKADAVVSTSGVGVFVETDDPIYQTPFLWKLRPKGGSYAIYQPKGVFKGTISDYAKAQISSKQNEEKTKSIDKLVLATLVPDTLHIRTRKDNSGLYHVTAVLKYVVSNYNIEFKSSGITEAIAMFNLFKYNQKLASMTGGKAFINGIYTTIPDSPKTNYDDLAKLLLRFKCSGNSSIEYSMVKLVKPKLKSILKKKGYSLDKVTIGYVPYEGRGCIEANISVLGEGYACCKANTEKQLLREFEKQLIPVRGKA